MYLILESFERALVDQSLVRNMDPNMDPKEFIRNNPVAVLDALLPLYTDRTQTRELRTDAIKTFGGVGEISFERLRLIPAEKKARMAASMAATFLEIASNRQFLRNGVLPPLQQSSLYASLAWLKVK